MHIKCQYQYSCIVSFWQEYPPLSPVTCLCQAGTRTPGWTCYQGQHQGSGRQPWLPGDLRTGPELLQGYQRQTPMTMFRDKVKVKNESQCQSQIKVKIKVKLLKSNPKSKSKSKSTCQNWSQSQKSKLTSQSMPKSKWHWKSKQLGCHVDIFGLKINGEFFMLEGWISTRVSPIKLYLDICDISKSLEILI